MTIYIQIETKLRELKKLKPRSEEYRTELLKFVGFCKTKGLTFEQIGSLLGVSKQYIFQVYGFSEKKQRQKKEITDIYKKLLDKVK